jgi:DNA polymerase-3 subunit chi
VTSVDFYFNAADRLQVACRLAAKALTQGKRMVIYAPQAQTAASIDRLLWTWPATGFVPHCAPHDPLAAETPVLIASGDEAAAGGELLVNLGAECPAHFERFERLFEIVSADDADKLAGRSRYRFYLDRGYRISNHDLAAAHE